MKRRNFELKYVYENELLLQKDISGSRLYNLQLQKQLVSPYKIQLHQEMFAQVPLEDASVDPRQTIANFTNNKLGKKIIETKQILKCIKSVEKRSP